MESSDSADEVRVARVQNNIHNALIDHGVRSGRAATLLTGVLCAVPSSLPGGKAMQIAADYV